MTATTVAGDIVKEYLEKHPELPSKTLARLILADKKNVGVFGSIEQARNLIRYYRGSYGTQGRKTLMDRRFLGTTPHGLPPSDAIPWDPFHIDASIVNLGIIGDLHIPYHSVEATGKGLGKLADAGIDALCINGDLADCYPLSRFEKDPRKRNLAGELVLINQFLDSLEDYFGDDFKIIYKKANHERRYSKYIMQFAPQLLDIPEAQFEHLIHAEERRNLTIVDDQRIIYFRDMPILHGDEQRGSSEICPAHAIHKRTGTSVIVHHFHRTSEYTHHTLDGKTNRAYSVGCLCELHPEYARINQWDHAVARLVAAEDGVEVNLLRL